MPSKTRLGLVGANVRSNWGSVSHFPALLASPDVELTAVCTTRPESAAEARETLGAKLAFSDWREMVASPEIDAVAVVVKVPEHYGPTKAALEAGKHVYTEWPLGRTTAEAEELAAFARARGVQTAVGLQSRVSPTLLYVKELIETGYVGEVLSCHVACMRDGALARPSSRTWQRNASLGANTLTIANGHVIDALRFVAGDFARVRCLVTTQAPQYIRSASMLLTTTDGHRVTALSRRSEVKKRAFTVDHTVTFAVPIEELRPLVESSEGLIEVGGIKVKLQRRHFEALGRLIGYQ